MAGDDEDLQALFFVECDENLGDLQARLDAMLAGDRDPETLNAAFRAVHSLKGGSAVFGFKNIVAFAHEFETVMDRIREGRLDPVPEICHVLLRAADLMNTLVEAVRAGVAAPEERVGHVLRQLAKLLSMDPADPDVVEQDGVPALSPELDACTPDEAEKFNSLTALLRPLPGFLLAGFDPARLVRVGRKHGLVSISVEGQLPPIDRYVPGDCPLSWRLEFATSSPPDELERILAPYAYCAEVLIERQRASETLETRLGASDLSWWTRPDAPSDGEQPEEPPMESGCEDVVGAGAMPALEPLTGPSTDSKAVPSLDASPSIVAKAAGSRVTSGAISTTDPVATVAAPAEPSANSSPAASIPTPSLRVDIERLDRLVDLVGEVLIAQAAIARGIAGGAVDVAGMRTNVDSLSRQTRELQESVMAIRAQPVRNVFARLPRVVRDLCDLLGKEARLLTLGEEVEVDTTVIEQLTEPLVHLIRNSMDHGIEAPDIRVASGKSRQGTLTVSAEQRGGRVRITLSDDGRGIDREKVVARACAMGLLGDHNIPDHATIDSLIFHPGFTTAPSVSSVSGRGVGMDVVRRKIQSLGGRCAVTSTPGKGTQFAITLPLTLAIMDGMAIRVAHQRFVLPLANVVEAVSIGRNNVSTLPDASRVFRLRGRLLPVFSLRAELSLPDLPAEAASALVIDTDTRGHVVVLVDEILGQRQVVIKSLETNVGAIQGVLGATILGDGRVALVLDVVALFRLEGTALPQPEQVQ